jgi:hypothetical protein
MSTHTYKLKKGDVELETDDRDLILRILGFKEEAVVPKLRVAPPKKVEIRETESSYYLGKGGAVSKICVEEVFKAIADSEKPYVLLQDLAPLEQKYSKVYVRRALQLLRLEGLIQSWRIGTKAAYKSLVKKKALVFPLKILEKEAKEAAEKASEESKVQEKVIHEGLK